MIRSTNISSEVEKEPQSGFGRCRYDLKVTMDGETKYYEIVTVFPCRKDILESNHLDPGLPTVLAHRAKATHYNEVSKTLPDNAEIIPCSWECCAHVDLQSERQGQPPAS